MTTEYKLKLRRALIEERQKLKGATGTMDGSDPEKPAAASSSD